MNRVGATLALVAPIRLGVDATCGFAVTSALVVQVELSALNFCWLGGEHYVRCALRL